MTEDKDDVQEELKSLLDFLEKLQAAGAAATEREQIDDDEAALNAPGEAAPSIKSLQMEVGLRKDGSPRVRFLWGDMRGIFSPAQARIHGVHSIEAGNLIELIAHLHKFLIEELHADEVTAELFVYCFRKFVIKRGFGTISVAES